jgi:glutathione peroxidase
VFLITFSSPFCLASPADPVKSETGSDLLQLKVRDIDGKTQSLEAYRGKVLLVVNTASMCGYTRQYTDLVSIQKAYADQGFTVLAFPCNDFGGQEPGSSEEIKSFCHTRFSVNFPIFEKVHAKGSEQSPLYQLLTGLPAPLGGDIRWNFTKFLVSKQGKVIARFEPGTSPSSDEVRKAIEAALGR